MLKYGIVWFLNGFVFPFAAVLSYENHHSISAAEHRVSLWKDVFFWGLLLWHLLWAFLSWKQCMPVRLSHVLKAAGTWLLGLVCAVLAVVIGNL